MTTAADIKSALRRRYGSNNATTIAFEVASGTGRHAIRHVDAVVFELWPSRGLALHAMEIKVSRSDFKRELSQGDKGEDIAQHCDYFSIVAPLHIIKKEELPSAWGLIEMQKDHLLKVTKAGEKTKAKVVDRHFMAALVRAVGKPAQVSYDKVVQEHRNSLESTFNVRVQEAAANWGKDGELWRKLNEDLKAAGVPFTWDEEVLKTVVFVMKSKIISNHGGVINLEKTLRAAADFISTAAKGLQITEESK